MALVLNAFGVQIFSKCIGQILGLDPALCSPLFFMEVLLQLLMSLDILPIFLFWIGDETYLHYFIYFPAYSVQAT